MSTYNADATVESLADAVAMDPKLKAELYSRVLEQSATQHNAFARMCSDVNPKTQLHGGVRSIFAKKKDLRAGGSDRVNFNVIGTPGGPGVRGGEELTGNTSSSLKKTYPIRVGWHRDGFEMTREEVEFLSAGRSLVSTTTELLAKKMGILKQHHMMMRLIHSVDGNLYRPNNAATIDTLTALDTLSLTSAISARARLRTLGGMPINHKVSETGSPIDGFLTFASDMAMLPIRNDDGFTTAVSNADNRGSGNANFSGEILKWQGMQWYEQPTVDEAWDDYIGSPLLPKMKVGVAFNAASAIGACVLKASATNTTSWYTGFFPGFRYPFNEDELIAVDSDQHYAWAINPDGTVAFLEYLGSDNNGNQIDLANGKILSAAAGVSTLGDTTVGEITLGAGGALAVDGTTRVLTGGTGNNLPAGFTYVDRVDVGALVVRANAKGVQIGGSFVFGAMSACYADGRISMAPIEQTRDFGFTVGRGFECIMGTGVTTNALGKPVGYLYLEHAIEHEGYPTPSIS